MSSVVATLAWTEDGVRKESKWCSDRGCSRGSVEEIVFHKTPSLDDLYALIPLTTTTTRWRFKEWKGWQVGELSSLIGMYE